VPLHLLMSIEGRYFPPVDLATQSPMDLGRRQRCVQLAPCFRLPAASILRAFLLLVPLGLAAHPCEPCHTKEVVAFSRTGMGRSLRDPGNEPEGAFTTASGTRFTIRSGSKGTWQRMERFGGVAEYQVAYVIGSGSHASAYLIRVGDHLFQSPICYYTSRRTYDLAPGYDRVSEPDFTRPVGEECVLCHSGRPLHIPGTANQYDQPVFLEEAISCERCHGPAKEHLRRPVPGSIINPAKLALPARDSICEQCHLTGVTQRILNPGKDFTDFHPGQRLEDVFTVYIRAGARAFKVISHAEQLALSACARGSQGKLWCGSCHDPHPQAEPTSQTYNTRCQECHEGKLEKSHPADTNCVRCHMTHRPAEDGAHTVFTDHRIRKPHEPDEPASELGDLRAWREPEPALEARNLALAYVNTGISDRSPAEIARGYRTLAELQRAAPGDIEALKGIGRALLIGGQPAEALKAFEWVLQLAPDNATSEEDLGVAFLQSGQIENAASHLERAVTLDPLLLSAGTALQEVYRRQGQSEKADTLAERMRRTMLNLPQKSGK
jgi:tetratricopeptide (TPR) repeat protein